jgi:hypothetical protein
MRHALFEAFVLHYFLVEEVSDLVWFWFCSFIFLMDRIICLLCAMANLGMNAVNSYFLLLLMIVKIACIISGKITVFAYNAKFGSIVHASCLFF